MSEYVLRLQTERQIQTKEKPVSKPFKTTMKALETLDKVNFAFLRCQQRDM